MTISMVMLRVHITFHSVWVGSGGQISNIGMTIEMLRLSVYTISNGDRVRSGTEIQYQIDDNDA